MRIVVTGANGMVGRPACAALTAAGHIVTAVVRDQSAGQGLAAGTVVAAGDLTGVTDWTAALAGAETIVHLAARTHVMAEHAATAEGLYQRANVGVTMALAQAALRAGVRRLVFVSSIKVNGERTTGVPFTADMQPAPEDWYGRSKAEAESRLLDLAAHGLDVVVLRPPLMYGPGVKGNMARLFAIANRRLPVPFASISNARDILSVDAFADLITRVVVHPAAPGRIFLARDGAPVSTPELFRAIAAALGQPAYMLPVPLGLLRLVSRVTGRAAEIERLTGDLEIDDRATRAALDWQPPITMAQALANTASWFKALHGA